MHVFQIHTDIAALRKEVYPKLSRAILGNPLGLESQFGASKPMIKVAIISSFLFTIIAMHFKVSIEKLPSTCTLSTRH